MNRQKLQPSHLLFAKSLQMETSDINYRRISTSGRPPRTSSADASGSGFTSRGFRSSGWVPPRGDFRILVDGRGPAHPVRAYGRPSSTVRVSRQGRIVAVAVGWGNPGESIHQDTSKERQREVRNRHPAPDGFRRTAVQVRPARPAMTRGFRPASLFSSMSSGSRVRKVSRKPKSRGWIFRKHPAAT